MDVVVVESPAKAKTINKYLGSNVVVLPSYGHVRDLPPKDGSVRPEQDFEMTYVTDPKSSKNLAAIASALKGAKNLYLATDPDREGEAISWHVLQALQEKKAIKGINVQRVVFNEITKRAVTEAMRNPRDLDMDLINAQQARRALDYLVGFTLSPLLWRKLPGAKSAGRVQSVALRLICEREIEIEAFKPREYWTIEGDFQAPSGRFPARLTMLDGRKLEKFDLPGEAAAQAAVGKIRAGSYRISDVTVRPHRRQPSAPFMTSTLQQEAARKLGFSATRTMQLAQRLYEGVDIGGETVGLITYMRTDGVQMAAEAIEAARDQIGKQFGRDYVPPQPRVYETKAKNAQEAHEAIRPTDFSRRPEDVTQHLDAAQLRLYELVWKRAIASQMEAAQLERTTVEIRSSDEQIGFRASGSVLLFPGFLKVYEEGRDDKPANGSAAGEDDEDGARLPKLAAKEALQLLDVKPEQHFTEPPPRYTEATLVKKLEELGIGRPSTYASIIDVLQERDYVRLDSKRFVPEDKGRIVTAFLVNFFERFFAYDFTANLEERLDEITAHQVDWKEVLREFWLQFSRAPEEDAGLLALQAAVKNLDELIGQRGVVIEAIDASLGPHFFPDDGSGRDPRACPACGEGRLGIRLGKNGAFIGCSRYPECRHTRPLSVANDNQTEGALVGGPRELGLDPESGLMVTVRDGRFGPYVQLGEDGGEEKPKRASIPREWKPAELTFETAIKLLALPRLVGTHPETGAEIIAGLGPYGAYLKHAKAYTRVQPPEEILDIGLNRAVALIAEGSAKKGPRRAEPKVLRELGAHPDDGAPVRILDGRFGAYVAHGGINATIPRGSTVEDIDMTSAMALLRARAERGPSKPKGRRGAKKTAAKTATVKSAAVKSGKKATTKPAADNDDAEPPPRKRAAGGKA
ncbi:type I DNA topoisomerase [Desertibaculum subflavum]|uniref:type I DNA topoisomerase n=1 Tax=Desertibaculum subflavum TaxID=2268458 RepID=UPI000E6617DA